MNEMRDVKDAPKGERVLLYYRQEFGGLGVVVSFNDELAGFTTPGPIGEIVGWLPLPEVIERR